MKDSLTGTARELRNNLTEAEKYLWYVLRDKNLGVKFRRQAVIGPYIVDFVCFENKLIVEVDGGQHCQNQSDSARDKWFSRQGFGVLRFWNNDVLENLDGVAQKIAEYLKFPLPVPPRKPAGSGLASNSQSHKGEGSLVGVTSWKNRRQIDSKQKLLTI